MRHFISVGVVGLAVVSCLSQAATAMTAEAWLGGPSSCQLVSRAKAVIEEAVVRNVLEARWIVTQTHEPLDRGYARNLIASSMSQVGVFTLFEACTSPKEFDPYCDTGCEPGEPCQFQRCLQLGCEAAGIDTARVWWQPAPSYRADQNPFANSQVSYRAQPTTFIRYDARVPGRVEISWRAEDQVGIRFPKTRSSLDASSSLSGRGVTTTQGPQSAALEISYPYLSRAGEPTVIDLTIHGSGHSVGTVRVGEQVVGRIVETGERPRVVWLPPCT